MESPPPSAQAPAAIRLPDRIRMAQLTRGLDAAVGLLFTVILVAALVTRVAVSQGLWELMDAQALFWFFAPALAAHAIALQPRRAGRMALLVCGTMFGLYLATAAAQRGRGPSVALMMTGAHMALGAGLAGYLIQAAGQLVAGLAGRRGTILVVVVAVALLAACSALLGVVPGHRLTPSAAVLALILATMGCAVQFSRQLNRRLLQAIEREAAVQREARQRLARHTAGAGDASSG